MEDLLATEVPSKTPQQRLFLLEVYANDHSPLTEAVQKLGFQAFRFTKNDGNLATFIDRQRLWDVIEKYQPEHIWMAPECGPWGGWNHLNKFKSIQLYDAIKAKQDSQLPHAKLCARICRFQVRNGRHFHLEQPAGSSLPHLKIFEALRQETATARFDMCRFSLRIPKTNKFLRKRSVLLTYSRQIFHAIHDQRCTNQHNHQTIGGSINIEGRRQRLTSFCATYCRGFADVMARNLCKNFHTLVGSDEHAIACHASGEENLERPAKRFRGNQNRFRKRRVSQIFPSVPNETIQQEGPTSGHESADPNPETNVLGPVTSVTSGSEPWKNVLEAARSFAPRVGNARCPSDSDAWRLAQEILHGSLKLSDVFVCRGTERYQVPLLAPPTHQFSLRYTVSLHQETSKIHDLGLENWHACTRAQRIRKSIPSHLTITMFGSVPDSESVPTEIREPGLGETRTTDEPESAVRATGSQNLPLAVHERSSSQACEGWAPPPVPLHGPKFRLLQPHEKQDLVKLHKNLGHPDPNVLSQHLKASGASEHVVEAISVMLA